MGRGSGLQALLTALGHTLVRESADERAEIRIVAMPPLPKIVMTGNVMYSPQPSFNIKGRPTGIAKQRRAAKKARKSK